MRAMETNFHYRSQDVDATVKEQFRIIFFRSTISLTVTVKSRFSLSDA